MAIVGALSAASPNFLLDDFVHGGIIFEEMAAKAADVAAFQRRDRHTVGLS